MGKKVKVLLLLLGIVCIASVGLVLWIYFAARAEVGRYSQKHTELAKQNSYLLEKIESRKEDARLWREKADSIQLALDKLSQEHSQLQGQYGSLLKAKDSLAKANESLNKEIERLSRLYAQAQEQQAAPQLLPQAAEASDEFLAGLLQAQAELKAQVQDLKQQLARSEGAEQPWQEKISDLEKIKGALDKELKTSKGASALLSQDLLQEKKKAGELEKNLSQTDERLKSTLQEKDKLADQLNKMKLALEQRLAELNKTKEVLREAVEGAKKVASQTQPASIQLPPIVVRAEEEPAAQFNKTTIEKMERLLGDAEISGQIITINEKHKFVVIDIGRDNGVEKGMQFEVYRNNKKIGKIEAIEVRQSIAACDIKELAVRKLQVSDIVRK